MPRPINIPAAALEALKKAGVNDIAVMTCIDKSGNMHYLKGDGVNDNPTPTFPIATTEIQNITPISLVQHKGSTCITYVSNGTLITYCW